MKNKNQLSKDIMWEALVTCNDNYDGAFFYAIKTTGIFCRPSCKSKTPNRKNVSFFFDTFEVQRAGYRPCKRCRPDLQDRNYDPLESVIAETKEMIEKHYGEQLLLTDIAHEVGVSPFHLNRIFKSRTGYTPRKYLEKIRIQKAKELLITTTLGITEIAFQIGYQSVSGFYNAFKRGTGYSPSQFQTSVDASRP